MTFDEFRSRMEDIAEIAMYLTVVILGLTVLLIAFLSFVAFIAYLWNALFGVRL